MIGVSNTRGVGQRPRTFCRFGSHMEVLTETLARHDRFSRTKIPGKDIKTIRDPKKARLGTD